MGPVSRTLGEVVGVSFYAPAHALRYLHVVFLVGVAGPTVPRCVVFDGESVSGPAPAGAVYQVAEPRADEGDQGELD